mgnify:CR=1 FL=1
MNIIKSIAFASIALMTIACEVDENGELIQADQEEICNVGVELNNNGTATLSTCGEINHMVETWIDLWTCDGEYVERLPWSRVIVASTDFDKHFGGQYTFTHNGVDSRDVADLGDVEACYVSWQMMETYIDADGIIRYNGTIASEGYNTIR